MAGNSWLKGQRGEWYVVLQLLFFALIIFGPRTLPGLPEWADPYAQIADILGSVLLIAGLLLIASGIIRLGRRNITPLPYPRDEGTLIETGPYRIVRHPIYSGGILAAIGWALYVHGWLTIGYTVLFFLFLDVKSRREERWLEQKFSGYPEYRRRVRKLIPFVY